MKKKIYGRKLGRGQGARVALYRSIVRAMVLSGSIKTTKTKAKNYQRLIDKLVSIAKRNTLASRRIVYSKLGNDREVVEKLYKNILPTLKEVKSGHTKRINIKRRKGDNAEIVRLEWNAKEVISEKRKEKSENKKSGKAGLKSIPVLSKVRKGISKK
jgi:large subunit ribosomal protein L17